MRLIDADKVVENIDEWLDSVVYPTVGKGLSYYGELIGCVDEAPTITPSDWVSVEDRLPNKTGQYLVYTEDKDIFNAEFDEDCGERGEFGVWKAYYSYDGYIGSDWIKAENITHWMPLPEPPKED